MANHDWELRIHHSVCKVVYPLPKQWALGIRNAIAGLRQNPYRSDSRKIQDLENTYEVLLDNYRIVYQVDEEKRQIKIAMINLDFIRD